jgi:hypothetical protein
MCWDPTNVRVNHSSHDTEASLTNLSRGPEDCGGQRLRLPFPPSKSTFFFFLPCRTEQKVGFLRIKSGSPPFPLLEAFGSHHWPGETTPFRVNLRASWGRGASGNRRRHRPCACTRGSACCSFGGVGSVPAVPLPGEPVSM